MATLTLRPTSGTGAKWTNVSNTYDGNQSTSGSVSTSIFNYSSRTLILNFDTSVIPSGATINSATLTIRSQASKTNITAYVDINQDSANRVIKQKQATSAANYTADVTDYMSDLTSVLVTAANNNWSNNTFVLYELWIDVDYTASTTYTVTFKDYDGSTIDTQTVPSGGSATPPTPTRTGYDFIGWSGGSYTNITSNTVLTAQYSIKTFTVRFLDWNNDVLDTQTVDYGGSATPPNDPTRTGYTFNGWNGTYTNITANTDITATYTINTYTVRFLDWNGDVLDTQIIDYGSDATPPSNPTREGYNFTGWSGSYTNIISDTDITAQYSIKTFTVRFLNWDNSVIDTQTINYGSNATPPNNPTRTGYTFDRWNSSYTNITANTDIKATYIINRYTVKFLDYNGVVLDTQTIEYNNNAIPPSDPARDGYRFTGWLGTYTNITQNTDITAQYVKIYNIVSSTPDSNAGSITPSTSVDEGGSKTFIITPKPGYRIKRVIVNGIDQGAISSYTFTNVNKDSTIEVEFEAISNEPIVIAAIEINKMYAIGLIEGETNMSINIDGIHILEAYEDLNENESVYLDENGILHVYEFIEDLDSESSKLTF